MQYKLVLIMYNIFLLLLPVPFPKASIGVDVEISSVEEKNKETILSCFSRKGNSCFNQM